MSEQMNADSLVERARKQAGYHIDNQKMVSGKLFDELADEITRLRAERPGWRTMESAPKDGTRVILAWGTYAVTGYYLDNSQTKWPWQGWKVPSMEYCPIGQPDFWQPFPVLLPSVADGRGEDNSAPANRGPV